MSQLQAKNEQDPSAIAALMQSLRIDPGNCEAIITLAASLTNESMQAHACYALQGTIIPKKSQGTEILFKKAWTVRRPSLYSSIFFRLDFYQEPA